MTQNLNNSVYKLEDVGSDTFLEESVTLEGKEYITKHLGTNLYITILNAINTHNIYSLNDNNEAIVNTERVNNFQRINKVFEACNERLSTNGILIGFFESKNQRKNRILRKHIGGFNYIYYTLDFILKRVFPKFSLTKKIYFYITKGRNRVLTKTEVFGRLYSCGFEHVDDEIINNKIFFVFKKIKEPAYDMHPTYGALVALTRVGYKGKPIKVYKFRTMHPYAEYLQHYIYKLNNLQGGGKFANDFRVTSIGRFMRKFWLDELPMIYNLLKGDLKLIGVRPISYQYFNLYSEETKRIRVLLKPGLIPPFYADMPKTLEDIEKSEIEYTKLYFKHPVRTDLIYLFRIIRNIIFKRKRSA